MADPLKMWLETDFGKAIAEHIQHKLWVFPLHGVNDDLTCTCGKNPCGENNKSAGKHPYSKTVPNGLNDAVNKIDLAAELFEYRTDLNVGVRTGKESGIIVVDVDNKNEDAGDKSLIKIQELFGILPPTMRLTTGNGYHLVFDYPKGGLKNSTDSFGADYPGVDIRGDGGYIVIYPSRHFSGRYYKADTSGGAIADLPKPHLDFLRSDKKKKKGEAVEKIDRNHHYDYQSIWSRENIQSAIDCIPEKSENYHDWVSVGFALHAEGMPFSMWEDWSRNSHKFNENTPGMMWSKWRGFHAEKGITIGTVIEWATVHGWHPKHEERQPSAEVDATIAPLIEKIKAKKTGQDKSYPVNIKPEIINARDDKVVDISIQKTKEENPTQQFCFNPLELPGGLGDTVRWITKYALYEQPELAMYNAIALAGAVFGRRYASPIDTRTNLYMVAIADTGLGKEHSVKMTEILALESGLINFVGENSIRSDIGLMKSVMAFPAHLIMVDEFGKLMTAMSDPKAAHHHKAVIDFFTKIYSKSSGVFKGGRIADDRAPKITIACPNLCIYGVTTEKSYTPSLKRAAIDSGDLNRFIVLPTHRRPAPKRNLPKRENDEGVVNWWKQFSPGIGDGLGAICNSATILPEPKIVEWGECEQRQYDIATEQTAHRDSKDENKNLWLRLHENTIKIAMIFAIARDPENPVMNHSDFDYAYNIVTSSIKYMTSLAETGISDTPQEQSHNDVLKAIVSAGEKGISRRDLLRKFRNLRKRDTDDLIATYKEEEVIAVGRSVPRVGRPQIIYFAADTEAAKSINTQPAVAGSGT